jgi:hypothetical protein
MQFKLLVLLAVFFSQSAFATCNDGKSNLKLLASNADYAVGFTPSTMPVPVGKHFSVLFEVCAKPGLPMPKSVKIDADMPSHKHGMNYKPKVSQTADAYLAEGLMFHMSGKWRVTFEFGQKDSAIPVTRLSQEIVVE